MVPGTILDLKVAGRAVLAGTPRFGILVAIAERRRR
jgi:hypothetical protein